MGWSNFLHNFLSGGDRQLSEPSAGGGFFGPGSVGASWRDYLVNDIYGTPTTESPVYTAQSTALRDALGREAAGAGEQFALGTNAGGFYDSGARLAGLQEINRNKMSAYSQGLTEILARLEQNKLQAAAPFLAAQIGGFQAYEGARQGAEDAGNYRANAHAQAVLQGFSMGMGGGGGSTGGYIPSYNDGGQASRAYGTYLGAGTDF